jgi:hypothetical protein
MIYIMSERQYLCYKLDYHLSYDDIIREINRTYGLRGKVTQLKVQKKVL